MAAFAQGKAKTISGIRTPNARTVAFDLTAPTGDFRYRLAMPAAGPLPREVAGCFTKAGEYGRYLISSGPYMLAGSDKLDASSCPAVKASGPISGFDGERTLDLVRNPAYDAKTDSPKARENLPDRFLFTVNSNTDDIFARIARGEIEDAVAQEPPTVLRRYQGSPQLRRNSTDFTGYLTMNLTPAAVRRRARAPRGQLRRRPQRAAQGARRRGRRRDRDPHRAERHPARQAQGLRAVRRVRPRRRSARPRPRCGSRATTRTATASATPRRAARSSP